MGSVGFTEYKDLPCQCPDGGLKEDDILSLEYHPNDGESGEKNLVCHRCNCLTDETVYVHVDKNLCGADGAPGNHGKPRFRGFKTRIRRPYDVFNTLMASIGVRGKRGPSGLSL